jgi:hypothetical protein
MRACGLRGWSVNFAVGGQDSRLLLGGSARLAVDVKTSVVSDLLLFHT